VADLLAAPTRYGLLVGAAVFVVGSPLFTAAMVRAKVMPRVPAWGYGAALTVFAGAARLPDTPLTSVLHVIVGVVLAWLSVAVWQRGHE
jgi:hypothetical protein